MNSREIIETQIIYEMEQTITLYLIESEITELPIGIFDGLTNLCILHIAENKITKLPELPMGIFDKLINLVQYFH